MTNKNIIISILNWNNAKLTIRCIDSLRKAGYMDDPSIDVHVVDNASEPEDIKQLRKYLDKQSINLHVNKENYGFAGGHNQIIHTAIQQNVPFVWLLNNDAMVDQGALESMMNVMKIDAQCGACSPIFAYEDTKEVYFAGAFQNWKTLSSIWCPLPWDEAFHTSHVSDLWLTGTALLLRTKAIMEIGLLDESLFAYCEDDDFGERLRLGKWTSRIVKDIVILHGQTPQKDTRRPVYFYYLTARNHTHFYLKYTPSLYRRFIHARLIAHSVHRSDLLSQAGHPELAHAVLAGLQDGLTGTLGIPVPNRNLFLWMKLTVACVRCANLLHRIFQRHVKV
jgi:hypothetical protein